MVVIKGSQLQPTVPERTLVSVAGGGGSIEMG